MLPVYAATDLKKWDHFTIDRLSVSSIELMEKAADACFVWIRTNLNKDIRFVIFCGNGNNGGDGLVVARKLVEAGCQVYVIQYELTALPSMEYSHNLERLENLGFNGFMPWNYNNIGSILTDNTWFIDALVGYGLNREPDNALASAINLINYFKRPTISIDIPSGLYPDQAIHHECVHSDVTLTFQAPKLAQLVASSGKHCGQLVILDIGLSMEFMEEHPPLYWFLEHRDISVKHKPRSPFSYKNQFGHVLLCGGQQGMAGAIALAGHSAIRSGAGLTSLCSTEDNRIILQSLVPEAMFCLFKDVEWSRYQVVALGPGMGQSANSIDVVSEAMIKAKGHLVLDADALNIISFHKFQEKIPKGSVLTPHPGEFDKLFGSSLDDFDRIHKARKYSKELEIVLILKGRYTFIACPDGTAYFNPTGNPGLSKGGSGDVLCGMVAAFLAQGYDPVTASKIAVYVHGLSGDLCASQKALESIRPMDLIDAISNGLLQTFYV